MRTLAVLVALALMATLGAASAGAAVTVGYGVEGGLVVEGTDAPEVVTVTMVAGNLLQVDADVPPLASAGCVPNGAAVICDAAIGVAATTIRLYGGDDRLVVVCPPGAGIVDGAGEAAVLDDFVNLGSGNDAADLGGCGDDAVDAGPGDDSVNGGTGADRLDGGAGRNVLLGGPGDDTFVTATEGAALGSDELRGGPGLDTADYSRRVGPVRVVLDDVADDGAPGEGDLVAPDVERVVGGAGADELRAGAGPAQLVGGPAADVLAGGPAADLLDVLDGAPDVIEACGAGRDVVRRDPTDPRPPADCEESDTARPGAVPVASLVRGRLRLDRTGHLEVRVACSADAPGRCRVRLRASLALAGTLGPQAVARVPAGETVAVEVRLTPRDARFVRRDGSAVLRIELVEALAGGGTATSVRWLLAVAR